MFPAKPRITKEMNNINRDRYENAFFVSPIGNSIEYWQATILGPSSTPFEGGIFVLNIEFGHNYPFTPPKCTLVTKIYHPNIDQFGKMSLNIIEEWTPICTVSKILISILSLLTDPNPEFPMAPQIAQLYKNNRAQYNEKAKEWTLKYAQ